MKPHFTKLALILLLATGCGSVNAQQSDLEFVRGLNSYIEGHGVIAFAQAANENGWKAPRISSRWYVENVASKRDASLEVERRRFGKGLEARVSELAPQMHTARESADIYKRSAGLIQIAQWLSASEGYGNLLLAARCKDVATVGLGRLVANLDFPMEKIADLLAALTPPSPSIRAKVLNQEVGAQLFSISSTQEDLEAVWRSGILLLLEQSSPQIKETVLRGSAAELIDTPIMRSHLSFFADDQRPNPPTTINLWNSKNHERMVLGLDVPNTRKLLALARFRQAVKAFPVKPTYANQFSSDGEAAFDEAWQPHSAPETHALFALAWLTYDLIQKGKFIDEDSGMGTGN